MKLLFDENLSEKLAERLEDEFPGSAHVRSLALATAKDIELFMLARERGFTMITKDNDFDNLAVLDNDPPKVIRIRLGNCTTAAVEILIRSSLERIRRFGASEEESLLLLP